MLLVACGSGEKPQDTQPADTSSADTQSEDTHNPDTQNPVAGWMTETDGGWEVVCATHTLRVELAAESVVRLRYIGADPGAERFWAVPDKDWAAVDYAVTASEDEWTLATSQLRVTVNRESCLAAVTDLDANTLAADLAYTDGTDGTRSLTRSAPTGARYLGFGEKTGALDKRGRVLEMWNSDTPAYTVETDPLYQSIPFYIELLKGVAVGVFTDNSYRSSFDVAATDADVLEVQVAGGTLDQYIIAGPAIADVVQRYTALTGRAPMPPAWALGYHQCRWSYWPASTVLDICEEFRAREIPADGIWLDIDYMDDFRSFTWDPDGFSDPAGLVSSVNALGFEVIAIIDPGLKVDEDWSVYQEGVAGAHFIADGSGEPFEGVVWPGASVFPDFTRSETRTWWGQQFGPLSDVGVWGIWLDMNEPASFVKADAWTLPETLPVDGDGEATTMAEAHNVYALLESEATRAGLLAENPNQRPFLLTRAGFAGIQRSAAVWTGDAASNFSAVADTLPMLLGMGLSGVPLVGSDVGGWEGGGSGELFARWVALGSVSPFFRAHVAAGTPQQEPWSFGEEVEDISRVHISERYRLLPTIYSLMWQASQTGAPILRPLLWHFGDDEDSLDINDQAMVGPWILVSPVLEEGAQTQSTYLPPGLWMEYHSGALIEGPLTIDDPVTLQALPLYLRQGAIVPRAQVMQYTGQEPINPLTLDLFPADEATTFTLYEDDGATLEFETGAYSAVTYTLQGSKTGATLSASAREGSFEPPQRQMVVRLRRVDLTPTGVTLDGVALSKLGSVAELEAGAEGWVHDTADLALLVSFADRADFILEMTYDPTITDLAPDVAVQVQVRLPEGTPTDTAIHISTDAIGWTQQALEWGPEEDMASGTVLVPRGQWWFYKYTRGDWSSVEKWEDCAEADNRYHFGKAWPVKEDSVTLWADLCP